MPCQQFHKEILSQEAFLDYAKRHFVLVELDFPKKTQQDPVLTAQNEELQKKMGVLGFPTLMLCDDKGKPYAQTGYARLSPQNYTAHLEMLRVVKTARDAAFAEAEKSDGLEKAKHLVYGLKFMDSKVVESNYVDVLNQITLLDPTDTLQYAKDRLAASAKALEESEINEKLKNFIASVLKPLFKNDDIAGVKKAISDFSAQNKTIPETTILSLHFNLILQHYMSAFNEEKAIAHVEEFAAANPESKVAQSKDKMIPSIVDNIRKLKAKAEAPANDGATKAGE